MGCREGGGRWGRNGMWAIRMKCTGMGKIFYEEGMWREMQRLFGR